MPQEPLLEIKNLSVSVPEDYGMKKILDSVNFVLTANTITALVGGSGSGKTTLGLAVLRLLAPGLAVESGEIHFNGHDLLKVSDREMRAVRGKSVGMVFQEPLNAFNPILTIGSQIEEVLAAHHIVPAFKRKGRVLELLRLSGITEPKRIAYNYPHQLSGGLRQRAMIAQAIAGDPKLIIADEPTSNLDVTIQAKILELFLKLKRELNLTILIVSHDLGLVEHLCEDVNVMCRGKLVESGPVSRITKEPGHPYTKELLTANNF